MSVFASVGILILSMLIAAFTQLSLGVFMLTSHYSYGKFSKKNASYASLFYILGAEASNALVFILIYFALSALYVAPVEITNSALTWATAGSMLAIGIIFPFCYFRKGPGTRLFISRRLAKAFDVKARAIKMRSDAFVLGFISGLPELIFTLPVYFVAVLEIMKLGSSPMMRAFLALLFVLAKTAPLLAAYMSVDSGHGIVAAQKARVKSREFVRFFVSISYLMIGALILAFGVYYR